MIVRVVLSRGSAEIYEGKELLMTATPSAPLLAKMRGRREVSFHARKDGDILDIEEEVTERR